MRKGVHLGQAARGNISAIVANEVTKDEKTNKRENCTMGLKSHDP